MRRISACMLELADGSGRDPVHARAVTKQWVGEQYDGWPEHATSPWLPAPRTSVRWQLLRDGDRGEEAFDLEWRRPHPTDPTLDHVVTVQVVTEQADGQVVVIEQLDSDDVKLRESPPARPRRADLVPRLLARATFVDGGWRVEGAPVRMEAARALELDAFIRGDRRLPVVLVAADDGGRIRADPDRMADALAGLAHVVVMADAPTVAAVASELGAGRSAAPGGVRLLWPSWRSSDAPGRHPSWPAEEVAGPDGPRTRVVEQLVGLVANASTLRVERHPLVDRLTRAAATERSAARRSELAAIQQAGLEDRAAAEELIGEYQAELSKLDDRVFQLELDLERAQEESERAFAAYVAVVTGEGGPPRPELRNLADAVQLARATLPHLVFLPEAEQSAREWQYDRADLVVRDFQRLERAAEDWAAGALRADFAAACRDRGLDWVTDVSATARARHPRDYVRTYRGREVFLGPHFRRTGRQLLRVYCYLDEARHFVVVGHVGGHLADSTT